MEGAGRGGFPRGPRGAPRGAGRGGPPRGRGGFDRGGGRGMGRGATGLGRGTRGGGIPRGAGGDRTFPAAGTQNLVDCVSRPVGPRGGGRGGFGAVRGAGGDRGAMRGTFRGRGRGAGGDRGGRGGALKRPQVGAPTDIKRGRYDSGPAPNGYGAPQQYSYDNAPPAQGYYDAPPSSNQGYGQGGYGGGGYGGAPSGYGAPPPAQYSQGAGPGYQGYQTPYEPHHPAQPDYSQGYAPQDNHSYPPAADPYADPYAKPRGHYDQGQYSNYNTPAPAGYGAPAYDDRGYGANPGYGGTGGFGQSRDYSNQPRPRY